MAEPSPTHCHNCGGPLQVTDSKCRFCQEPIKGKATASRPALPAEFRVAIERLRTQQRTPEGLLDHLADALPRILPRSAVRIAKGGRQLEARIGTMAYTFRHEGGGLVVERQSVAGGFAVGMKDLLPASRWPEQLVVDIANDADATGHDWKSAVAAL